MTNSEEVTIREARDLLRASRDSFRSRQVARARALLETLLPSRSNEREPDKSNTATQQRP